MTVVEEPNEMDGKSELGGQRSGGGATPVADGGRGACPCCGEAGFYDAAAGYCEACGYEGFD